MCIRDGASNHANLVFRSRTNAGTGGTEALRITNDGNVGIGTTNPSDLLHLAVNASGDQSVLRLSNANATANNTVGINFAPGNAMVTSAIKGIAEDSGSAVAERDGAIGFFTRLNGGSTTEKVRIDSSGNVGIGTTSPATYGNKNLEVNGGSGGAYLVVKGANDADIGELAADGDIYLSAKTSSALIFRTADTQRMRIDSAGNVGIGTASPGALLHLKSNSCLLYTSPSPRDATLSRMPSSA